MAEVKTLVRGYAKKGDIEFVTSTTTLVKDSGFNVIIDPGMNKTLLTKSLEAEGLKYDDIDYVIITHNHPDHVLLAALFSRAKVVDAWSIYSFEGEILPLDGGKIPRLSLEILQTPGHSPSHISILVKNDKDEKIIIAGDVIWWWDDEEQLTDRESLVNMVHKDLYAKDFEQLQESRKKVLEIADYIIPGHGEMFKVKR